MGQELDELRQKLRELKILRQDLLAPIDNLIDITETKIRAAQYDYDQALEEQYQRERDLEAVRIATIETKEA